MPTPPADTERRARSFSSRFMDLAPRLLSALGLAAVSLGLTYWGQWPFAALILAVAVLLCWEWGGIVRGQPTDFVFAVHAVAVGLAVALAAMGLAGPALITLAIGTLVVGALRLGEKTRLSAFGVFYAGIPAVALLWLRGDEPFGFSAILFLFVVVWMTDIGAYAAGRALGGPKLWPAVSPGKTWAGLVGGVAIGVLCGVICAYFFTQAPAARLALTALILALAAQAGDLAESALKRGFGVKDASSLIPGHGGFMDRVDGLIAATIAAAIIALAANMAAPAKALLFWS